MTAAAAPAAAAGSSSSSSAGGTLPPDSSSATSAEEETRAGVAGWAATLGVVGGLAALLGGGYLCRDAIRHFLQFFISAVDDWGVWGYVAYAAVYAGLEVLAVPAIPLTMTAGVIFGPLTGTAIVSLAGTAAATIAFLIARYAARDKVCACDTASMLTMARLDGSTGMGHTAVALCWREPPTPGVLRLPVTHHAHAARIRAVCCRTVCHSHCSHKSLLLVPQPHNITLLPMTTISNADAEAE